MQNNPAEEWRALAETYRAMFDGELENLAADMDDLTETAREVLRAEMKARGLGMPGERRSGAPEAKGAALEELEPGEAHFVSAVDPDVIPRDTGEPRDDEPEGGPVEFTWKVPLCECDSRGEAWEIHNALSQVGIECWVEDRAREFTDSVRLVVAADRLDEAREIAARPIPKEVLDDYDLPVLEFVPPKCPQCGNDEPVLEDAEPTNSWFCEACGHQWTDPVDEDDAAG